MMVSSPSSSGEPLIAVEVDPTRMCELLVGLPEVTVLGIVDEADGPLWVHVETRAVRPVCAGCGSPVTIKDRPMVTLVDLPALGSHGERGGRRARLTTTIGRDPRCNLVLDDVSVSRHHAEVRRIGPAYVVADGGSFNGTYVNGIRVSEVLLEDLDDLQIGRFRIGFFAPR